MAHTVRAGATIAESGFRPDLVGVHCAVIGGLGRSGTWWTGEQRVAIAREVRRSLDHGDLAPWQLPSAAGLLDGRVLPDVVVDAIWRISNHPGTLTAAWYEDTVARFPSPRHYVEMVGLVAVLNSIERFSRSLHLAPLPLPVAEDGDPSEDGPESSVTTHWVPTAPTTGPMVLTALSAVPAAGELMRALSDAQYVPFDALLGDLTWSRGTLTRQQIELVAAQTSLRNECFY